MADLVTIKKIRTAAGDHLIDATYLGGHTFEQIESMVHGGVETYVIPSSKSSVSGYTTIVDSTESTLTTTKTVLDSLTDGQANGGYKLGDVILMEATSDGKKVFDRWVSKVEGENITLAVLETQVAKHHHTVSVTTSKAKALTSATPTSTDNAIPTVGSAVTVLTGTSGEVITSVVHDDKGGHNLAIATATSTDGIGHSHTVKAHSHTVKFTPSTLVSENVAAYTSLTSANHTPHTHTNATVAGAHVDASKFTYATGGGSTDTFIKTLTDSSSTTNTGGRELTTNANTAGLTTSTQASTDTVGSTVLTLSNGAHTHTVTTTTTSDVVTSVSLAGNVTTSAKLNYTAPTVQASVVTAVTYTSAKVVYSASLTGTTTFMSTWSANVDDSGVLSFATSTASVGISAPTKTMASTITVTTKSQSAGSASLTVTSATQTYTSGKVGASGNAASAGAHQHGFSHTHAIPSHTHGVASHTHTYVKTVASTTGSAYTSLSTSSYTPHTHTNTTVAGAHSNGSPFKYLTGGSTTDVVRNLKDVEQSYTSTTSTPGTDAKYYKLSGDITYPGLTLGKKTLSTTTVTPAVAGTEKPIKSITYGSSSNFITGVTVDNSGKTSTNIGGE
jgi:hypothetical protein